MPACIDFCDTITFEEKVALPMGQGLKLDAVLHYNESSMRPTPVLIVPPHPCFAGTMENNVVKALANHLVAQGYLTMRFNYPGIGLSDPPAGISESAFDYWDRVEKNQDMSPGLMSIHGAAAYLRQVRGSTSGLFMLGYSYGALLALQAAREHGEINGVVAVATPWRREYDFSWMGEIVSPVLLMSGERDFVWNRDVWNEAWRRLPDSKSRMLLDDDHFFRGTEDQLALPVSEFFLKIETDMARL